MKSKFTTLKPIVIFKLNFLLNNFTIVILFPYKKKQDYQHGIRLIRMSDKKVLITFNARNKNDQHLFCKDLSDAIAEVNLLKLIRRIKNRS